MTDVITNELFDHLVQLAALQLTSEEAEYLRQQLNNQLKAIHELEAIPLEDDTPATSHGVPYTKETTPSIRSDEPKSYNHPEEIVAQSPENEDGYIVVPDIPHTKI
jgi:aspartyl/glutamyl-tRNA(Asn/Gln) amidotransferase C subunit